MKKLFGLVCLMPLLALGAVYQNSFVTDPVGNPLGTGTLELANFASKPAATNAAIGVLGIYNVITNGWNGPPITINNSTHFTSKLYAENNFYSVTNWLLDASITNLTIPAASGLFTDLASSNYFAGPLTLYYAAGANVFLQTVGNDWGVNGGLTTFSINDVTHSAYCMQLTRTLAQFPGELYAVNGFSTDNSHFTFMPTNTPTDGYVITAAGTAGHTKWAAGGAGSQTPWTSDIDGAGFNLTNVGALTASSMNITGTLSTPNLIVTNEIDASILNIGTNGGDHIINIIAHTNSVIAIDSDGTDSTSMLHIANTGSQGPFFDFHGSASRWGYGVASGGAFNIRKSATGTDPVNGSTLVAITTDGLMSVTNITTGGYWRSPTNGWTDGQVLTGSGSNGDTKWATPAAGGGVTFNNTQFGSANGTTNIILGAPITNAVLNGVVQLTDAATVAVDLTQGTFFKLAIGGNRTLGKPTGGKDGQQWTLEVTQDSTGNRTLSLPANNDGYGLAHAGSPGITGILLSTNANYVDFVKFVYRAVGNGTNYVLGITEGY